jgi:LCP family protein required for cell wall assembly
MTQVEAYPPRRVRRKTGEVPAEAAAPPAAGRQPTSPRPARQRPTEWRPTDTRTTAPRAGHPSPDNPAAGRQRPAERPPMQRPSPQVAGRQAQAQFVGLEYDRRGSHATIHGQDFSWVLLWTILGALIPGTGLIAAGRRRLGIFLLLLLGLTGVSLIGLALSGKLQDVGISLAFNSTRLFALAVAAAVIGLGWILVIVLTNTQLRRYASLDSGQKLFSAVVVLALITAVVLPAYKVGSYAMITRSVITSGSVFKGDTENGTNSGPGTKADPWADKPQMNVLLIGSDAGADRTGIRPDTLILASINTKTGKTVMFSLPRSLQHAAFPAGTGGHQAWPNGYYCPEAGPGNECLINAIWVWAEGDGKRYYSKFKQPGLRATEDAVEGTLGLKVDTYVMLNLSGFRDFVDALGGVTVDVHERLPIGGNTHHMVATGGYIEKGNNQHLDGYHALWFARSRWSTNDYDRMQRQRCVIGAVVDQSNPLKVVKNFPALAKALKKNLVTGIDDSDLSAWATLAQRIQKGGVTSVVFDPTVISTVNPDITAIHELVAKAVKSTAKVKKATVSASASPSPSATAKTTTKKNTTPGKAESLKSVC